MITATADSRPEGNGRFITPRLNEGDIGILAIKLYENGTWGEVRTTYEIEKGIRLPLIKGRHDEYEKVYLRLSGKTESPQPPGDVRAQKEPTKTASATAHPPSLPLTQPKVASEEKATPVIPTNKPVSSTPWNIIVVLIVAATGLLWLLLKGRK